MFARYYNSATGRFLSPDWSAKAEPVPYAKLGDPQTLNLYAYVRNNPLGIADRDGHGDWWDTKGHKLGSDGTKDGSITVANHVAYTGKGKNKTIDALHSDVPMYYFSHDEGVAMHQAVDRSNKSNKGNVPPGTVPDATGGMHEEGFTVSGGKIQNAAPGSAVPPGGNPEINLGITSDTDMAVHVHPEGAGNAVFQQPPSPQDRQNTDVGAPGMTSAVVGAGSGQVYIYNNNATQDVTVPLSAFPSK